jgi:hypothetical protein
MDSIKASGLEDDVLEAIERSRAALDLHTENCALPGSQEEFGQIHRIERQIDFTGGLSLGDARGKRDTPFLEYCLQPLAQKFALSGGLKTEIADQATTIPSGACTPLMMSRYRFSRCRRVRDLSSKASLTNPLFFHSLGQDWRSMPAVNSYALLAVILARPADRRKAGQELAPINPHGNALLSAIRARTRERQAHQEGKRAAPRPEQAIPPDLTRDYDARGWLAAQKEQHLPHKLWQPSEGSATIFQSLPGNGWYVLNAELLHSKTAQIKDVDFIFDI